MSVGGGTRAAGLTTMLPGPGSVPPRRAVEALRDHPDFRDAVRAWISGLVERYSRNGLLNRVVNDRCRLVGSLIAFYAMPGADGRRHPIRLRDPVRPGKPPT